jgi:hypothetical protein
MAPTDDGGLTDAELESVARSPPLAPPEPQAIRTASEGAPTTTADHDRGARRARPLS